MNTTSQLTGALKNALQRPTNGVVGLVDELLTLCPEQGLQLHWQSGLCRVGMFNGGAEELFDVPLPKSVFRAILARLAALCNERSPDSVSPYGGHGVLQVGADPTAAFELTFANTTNEHTLALVPQPPHAGE